MGGSRIENETADLLVVDCSPVKSELLSERFRASGYRVRSVPNGRLALIAAVNRVPDLVILDIDRPEMDGVEVCRRLKADQRLKAVPIVFVSALLHTTNKIRAFQAGAVDYVTKPFRFEEVEARVVNHVEQRWLHRELENRNTELESSYSRLKELERMRESLTHMILHDMRNPLTSVNCFMEVVRMRADGLIDQKTMGYLHKVDSQISSVAAMVNDILDLGRFESEQMPLEWGVFAIGDLLREARNEVGLEGQRVFIRESGLACRVRCDGKIIRRVVSNILSNALRYTPKPKTVEVFVHAGEDNVQVNIRDQGSGIPEEYWSKVFDKFFQIDDGRKRDEFTSGLGLAFCKMAVEAHGQVITVDSIDGEGSRFYFALDRVMETKNTTSPFPEADRSAREESPWCGESLAIQKMNGMAQEDKSDSAPQESRFGNPLLGERV